ncbi:MAG: hypothetical protein IOMNBAOH_02412 [Rhodocyclaceae bacterium]|nr:hypothetical protein [Rhodocyclaceae bacterium]
MLGLGIDADGAPQFDRLGLGQIDGLLQGRNDVLIIVCVVAEAQVAQTLLGADVGTYFRGGEVFREPTTDLLSVQRLHGQPAGILRQLPYVGAGVGTVQFRHAIHVPDGAVLIQVDAREQGLVPGEQFAVPGHDQIGLNVAGPLLDGQRIAFERVLGPVTGRAAMADHDRRVPRQRVVSTRFGHHRQ